MMADWTDGARRDGVRIEMPTAETYVARHPDGRTINVCPCCYKLIWTPEGAKRVADFMWPIASEAVAD